MLRFSVTFYGCSIFNGLHCQSNLVDQLCVGFGMLFLCATVLVWLLCFGHPILLWIRTVHGFIA